MTTPTPARSVSASPLRALATTVYIPAATYGIGTGAAAPVMTLRALELGASVAVAGLTVALIGLGQVVGDLQAGQIVARLGERRSIIVASSVAALGVLVCIVAPTVLWLCAGILLVGLANSVWGLARQNYLSLAVPFEWRARAMSMFGGTMRLGFFIGPLLGAGAIWIVGVRGGFVVQLVAVVVAGVLMARLPDPPGSGAVTQPHSVTAVFRRHARVLGTLGAGSLLLGVARASREAVLPLWAHHLGASAGTASLIFGVGALLDVVCSYPAGHLMDRFSRRFVAIPSIVVLALSYLLVPFTSSIIAFTAVAILMGIGNGFGNGVIMTLGADVAPDDGRAEFLAAWRLTHDSGFLLGPLSISAVVAFAPLSAAIFTVSALSAAGAGLLGRYMPPTADISVPAVSASSSPAECPHR